MAFKVNLRFNQGAERRRKSIRFSIHNPLQTHTHTHTTLTQPWGLRRWMSAVRKNTEHVEFDVQFVNATASIFVSRARGHWWTWGVARGGVCIPLLFLFTLIERALISPEQCQESKMASRGLRVTPGLLSKLIIGKPQKAISSVMFAHGFCIHLKRGRLCVLSNTGASWPSLMIMREIILFVSGGCEWCKGITNEIRWEVRPNAPRGSLHFLR